MKTYFVISDIHGFYQQMVDGLRKAGFRKNNKDHILVVLGDLFDRGPEPFRVYKYIKSLPKSRRILVRGNHEALYLELLKKDFPQRHDFSNRTVNTLCDLTTTPIDLLNEDTYDYDEFSYIKGSRKAWEKIVNKMRDHEITKWLESDEWVNYFELDKYIMVHSFIPLEEDWKNGDWDNAIWGCPWRSYQKGYFKKQEDEGKVLVCGHWHTSDFYSNLKFIHDYDYECCPIYYSEHLIGIDGGVMYNPYWEHYTHHQNVLVIKDDDFNTCYDENGFVLVEPFEKFDIITECVEDERG